MVFTLDPLWQQVKNVKKPNTAIGMTTHFALGLQQEPQQNIHKPHHHSSFSRVRLPSNTKKPDVVTGIIISAFKGAIRYFLQSPQSAANCPQLVR